MQRVTATSESCFWGFLDPDLSPVLTVADGTELVMEAVTHHAGDAPDLLMDDGIRALWAAIPESDRGPGVHIMTGPIWVDGAMPGDALRVELIEMTPRLPFGANCAAHWGLLYDIMNKERITVYELVEGRFGGGARPLFGYDFETRALYDVPGVVTPPELERREPFTRAVEVPVRPHLGVIGVAPLEAGRRSSIPPDVFGGNVDDWRFGTGATIYYPVFHEGAGFYVGDPHFARGDGEICGTAIEASLDVRLRLSVAHEFSVEVPTLETETHWYLHGFGDDLDAAMRMTAECMLRFLVDRGGFTTDEAYSIASVAVDFGVTQVVDGKVGCHAAVAKPIVDPVGAH